MEKDKLRLIFMIILAALVLGTSILYGYTILFKDNINLGSSIALIIPLLAVLFMIFFITNRYKDVKEGMPIDDERSKQVMTKAAAMTFYISLYWLLLISFFESSFAKMFDQEHLDAGQAVSGGIAGMTVIFMIAWLYYNKKGKLQQ